jgi:hypothetical protein
MELTMTATVLPTITTVTVKQWLAAPHTRTEAHANTIGTAHGIGDSDGVLKINTISIDSIINEDLRGGAICSPFFLILKLTL